MKVKGLIAVLVLATFTFTGCASIVGQSTFPVTFDSNPTGAHITVVDDEGTNVYSGPTPATVTLAAGESYFHAKSYDLIYSRPGYADQHAQLRADIDGWYFANIVSWGIIGFLIVDPITGKMWKLPLHKTVYMNDEKSALNDKSKVLRIATLDQVPESMRKEMISLN